MHLLVGVDGSDDSLAALSATVDRVSETGDDLTVALLLDAEAAADVDLDELVRDALGDVNATRERVSGDPASRLVELADGGPYDRLVVGGGSRSPLGKVNLDQFLEFVLLNATTTLTLVR
ncbi:MAG: universal stress protein [Haloarculaceae archaeon]